MQDFQPTEIQTLKDFAFEAKRIGLRYIYIDDPDILEPQNTSCYNCGATVIERIESEVINMNLVGDRCPDCGFKIDVIRE